MSEFVLCISLVLGTPRQKKGNEGQTENIRIIEISGKIFCVRTCHVSCVRGRVLTVGVINARHFGSSRIENIYLKSMETFLSNTQQVLERSSSWAEGTSPLSWCVIFLSDKAI